MAHISGNELIQQLNWRYAVKKFDATKKISAQDWNTLAQTLVLSPSSYGVQPWKFIVVQNPEVRKQLTPLSWNQTQVADCSHFVVFTHMSKVTEDYVKKFVHSTAQIRGVPAESLKAYQDMMIGDFVKGPRSQVADLWTAKQVYIAMGFLMSAAAMLNIDTCPMEGLDPAGYDKVLGLTGTEYKTVAAVACGYRSDKDDFAKLKKSRFPVSDIVKVME